MNPEKIREAAGQLELATLAILSEIDPSPATVTATGGSTYADAEHAVNVVMDTEDIRPDHLIVGYAEGRPGDTVTVDVLGGTTKPVFGFGAYVGMDPRLVLTGSDVAPEVLELADLGSMLKVAQQKRGQGIEGFLSLSLSFMGPPRIGPDATDDEAEAEKERLRPTYRTFQLPPRTPLLRLSIRIPESMTPGTEVKLDNTPLKYGVYMRDPVTKRIRTQRLQASFGVPKEFGREIIPDCVSGWVKVNG